MRIYLKGGVWKNSEDEILKAAVMKYGLNNWSRVASLLVRKSAKQCKARWYEWLDPSVKKTEWSREEEEKLLHLAKLFPTQWRTIAPIVGRTAHQCLEHYERLLDHAQGKDRDADDYQDPRRLRPGEIDPHPETKPSRADAVDLDDDEREMLAEARARLANTRGKKAKRKAREKQLEEARRLAVLQKKRELKAAGLRLGGMRPGKKERLLDLEREVPFERKPPPGFHEVSSEETPQGSLNFANISLQQLEGERRDTEEERHRRDDQRKLKRLQEQNLPEMIQKMTAATDPSAFRKRTKLSLPEPQLADHELVEIVRLGSDAASLGGGIAGGGGGGGEEATAALVGNYAKSVSMTPMRTPRQDLNVMLEAQNAVMRNSLQTPLEGGENPVLAEIERDQKFSSTPSFSTSTLRTPNPLALRTGGYTPSVSHGTDGGGGGRSTYGGRTPSVAGSVAESTQTPFRDDLSLNEDMEGSGAIGYGARADLARLQVKLSLANLPAPQNDVEVALPDESILEQNEAAAAMAAQEEGVEEDMDDIIRRREMEEKKKVIEEWRKQSQVIQFGLPRPFFPQTIQFDVKRVDGVWREGEAPKRNVSPPHPNLIFVSHSSAASSSHVPFQSSAAALQKGTGDSDLTMALSLINDEIKMLVLNDAMKHPLPGVKPPRDVPPKPYYSPDELMKSHSLIEEEAEKLRKFSDHGSLSIDRKSNAKAWDQALGSYLFCPSQKRYINVHTSSKKERLESYLEKREDSRRLLELSVKKVKKLEKKYQLYTAGYLRRVKAAINNIDDAYTESCKSRWELNAFSNMRMQEAVSGQNRTMELKASCKAEKEEHQVLQQRYVELKKVKDDLTKLLEST